MSQAPVCGFHSIPAKWKEGKSKSTGKAYAFWSCPFPKDQNGGEYCAYKFDGEPKPFFGNAAPAYQPPVIRAAEPTVDRESLITRTAIVKSLLEGGRKYSVESCKEFQQWLNLIEGKTIKIEAREEEPPTDDAFGPF